MQPAGAGVNALRKSGLLLLGRLQDVLHEEGQVDPQHVARAALDMVRLQPAAHDGVPAELARRKGAAAARERRLQRGRVGERVGELRVVKLDAQRERARRLDRRDVGRAWLGLGLGLRLGSGVGVGSGSGVGVGVG